MKYIEEIHSDGDPMSKREWGVGDDFFESLIVDVVEMVFDIVLDPDNEKEMAEAFGHFRDTIHPIVMNVRADTKYARQMEKVKDAKGEEEDGSKTTV